MLAIFTNPAFDFIGKRRWAYVVSVAVMLLALGSMLVKGGLHYDIDFTGGRWSRCDWRSRFRSGRFARA